MPRPPIVPRERVKDPWSVVSAGLVDIISMKQSNLSLAKLHGAVGQMRQTNQSQLVSGL